MKTILILSYYFPPAGGGGVQRILKFLKYADKEKYNFKVLTASSSGLLVNDHEMKEEIPENVEIIRVENVIPHDKINKIHLSKTIHYETSAFKRWMSSLLFVPDSRRQWIKAINKCAEENSDQFLNIDLMIASMPPYSAGIAAAKLSEKFNIPFILDYRDGWLFNHFQFYPTFFHKLLHKTLEQKVLKKAKGIIFVNNGLKQKYLEDFKGINWDNKQIKVIYNGFDEEDFLEIPSMQKKPSGKINIGLPGTIYFKVTRPLTLLEYLKSNKVKQKDKMEFHITGKWTKAFEKKVKKYGITEFFNFSPYLSHKEYLIKINKMDYNFLFLEMNARNIECVIPGRFYELLKSNVPLVAWGPEDHEILNIVKRIGGKNEYQVNNENNINNYLNEIEREIITDKEDSTELNKFSRKVQTKEFLDFIEHIFNE